MQESPIVTAPPPSPDCDNRPYSVLVLPLGQRFTAMPGQSLLRAAEDAGIELPSSCRNGTCRTCISLRESGISRHLIAWPGLDADEKAQGWILPCVAEAQSELTLHVPSARALFED